MKRISRALALFVLSGLVFSGCTSYKGMQIVAPEFGQTVSELSPTLQWQEAPGKDVTYELVIYEEGNDKPVYHKKGLTGNNHTVEIELKPNTLYKWSIRSKTGDTFSEWSKKETRVFTGVSYHRRTKKMEFSTPAVE
ncbi:MAG: hypothetical protein WGN25_14445 [Candidatus Electrothrix sp. GW3-4]|uniref:hypothetical protein n=1 Tax=Candidatus Electrothrix sp. GW3-4 TaxID=3126740 RepID=UPI0030CDFA8C